MGVSGVGHHAGVSTDLDAVFARLSPADRAALTGGADLWRTVGLPDAGVPVLKVTDGPSGARGDMTSGTTSTGFPCGAALGATWDTALLELVGSALAEETRAKGAHVLLGPTVNLHRHPLAGRSFECYSEDPELTARLAVAFIGGLQDGGIGACIKHYVANDQEHERMSISSELDEVTLRELYLRPFEAVVAEVDPWTIMAAYNRIGGEFATEHHRLQVEVLKQEWGWPGAIISDWYATHDTVGAANGGLDLEMPGPAQFLGPHLAEAVARGEVDQEVVDEASRRMLHLLERAGRFADPASELEPERSEQTPERDALARRAVGASVTLLRNEAVSTGSNGDGATVLPLAKDLTSLAVIGPGADPGWDQGGGSAQVSSHQLSNPLTGLRAALPDTDVRWIRGAALGRFAPPIHHDLLEDGAWRVRFWSPSDDQGDPLYETRWRDLRWSFLGRKVPGLKNPTRVRAEFDAVMTPDQSGPWTFFLTAAGTASVEVDGERVLFHEPQGPEFQIFPQGLEGETVEVELTAGTPVTLRVVLDVHTKGVIPHVYAGAQPPDPSIEWEAAAALAAEADAAVVVVGTGLEFETEGEDRPDLVLPGDQDAFVERVLDAQPNTVVVVTTGAPVLLPWLDRAAAVVWAPFGGQEAGNGLADVLTGVVDPGGRLPTSWVHQQADVASDSFFPGADGHVTYGEGLLVGQRGLDAAGTEALLPFGHGGSYTTFDWGTPVVQDVLAGESVWVTVPVTNTGERVGQEVVQVYVGPPGGETGRPIRQLAGFAKATIPAGETVDVSVELKPRTLALWDEGSVAWRVPAGTRTLSIARSAAAIECTVDVEVPPSLLATPQP
jgi:beta-glucosidase